MKLVSAIMPTRGRREFARLAVESFLAQTYEPKELVVLDDYRDPSFPAGKATFQAQHPIIYELDKAPGTIPARRNRCCAIAGGEIICHWDSDDWSAPERISDQVARLEEHSAEVTGYSSPFFWDVAKSKLYQYLARPKFAVGTSLCYRKRFLNEFRFPEALSHGEDNEMVEFARRRNVLAVALGGPMIVARVHPDNTCKKILGSPNYRPVSIDECPSDFLRPALITKSNHEAVAG